MIEWTDSNEDTKCEIKRGGYCRTHEVMTKKFQVSSKKWADRGGGRGYGYVNKKVMKYVCSGSDTRDLSNTNMNRNIPNMQDLEMLVRNNDSEGLNVDRQ